MLASNVWLGFVEDTVGKLEFSHRLYQIDGVSMEDGRIGTIVQLIAMRVWEKSRRLNSMEAKI